MNISFFQLLLQEAIDNSNTTMDYLFLARALASLNMGQIRSVTTYANLPPAASNEGLLMWVTADERLYWSTGSDWYPIVTTQKGITWAWGSGGSGRLGNLTTDSALSPVSVVGGIRFWCQVSAGSSHQVAVTTSGGAWSWGNNAQGRLGDNTTTNRSSPVSVTGGIMTWCQISAGTSHTVAVTSTGDAWAWGTNSEGRLGDNSTTSRSSPVSVMGGITSWCQISGGGAHTVAVTTAGDAWTWGLNTSAQLGNGTDINQSSPVSVVGGITSWCQASGGNIHTMAITTSGDAWAWGSNTNGRLGDDTTTLRLSPVSVVGGITSWCQISGGGSHTVAVTTSGDAWAWGLNSTGQLGDDTVTSRRSPVSVVGGITSWCQVSGGFEHSLAVTTSGDAWAWGLNSTGQLGDGTTTIRSSPVSVIGGITSWCTVSAGVAHTTAISFDDFT
jgi:alpha-tubulin suppressor-like RCC1 family protein